jgi:hypothetical protein
MSPDAMPDATICSYSDVTATLRPPIALDRYPATDLRRVIAHKRPAILVGLLEGQPQLTLDELGQRWGDRLVPIVPTSNGAATYTAEGVAYQDTILRAYLARLDEPEAGLLSARPEDYLPGVTARLPDLCPGPRVAWRRSRLWVSPANVVTPLHHEVTANLLAQLEGEKDVTLYSPLEHRAMYPHRPWSRMPHMSRVAAHDPDLSAQPRFSKAQPFRGTLHVGEVLYIPRLWWHWVLTRSASLSHNTWFAGPAVAFVARGLEHYKTLRALRI